MCRSRFHSEMSLKQFAMTLKRQTIVLVGGLRNNDVHSIANYETLTLSQALFIFHMMLTEPQEVATVTTTILQMRKQKHRWVCNLHKTTKLVRHREPGHVTNADSLAPEHALRSTLLLWPLHLCFQFLEVVLSPSYLIIPTSEFLCTSV